MRTFELTDGADRLTLDAAGSVTKAATPVGTWTTNNQNQIVDEYSVESLVKSEFHS